MDKLFVKFYALYYICASICLILKLLEAIVSYERSSQVQNTVSTRIPELTVSVSVCWFLVLFALWRLQMFIGTSLNENQ